MSVFGIRWLKDTPTSETVGNGLCAVPPLKGRHRPRQPPHPKARYKSFPRGKLARLGEPDEGLRGSVKHSRNCRRIRRNVPRSVIQALSASGVEESTTLDNKPTQDKTCHLGRFLDSHSFARNDMSVCGSVHPHELYSGRFRNGTQAVPYSFADWCIFLNQRVLTRHVRCSDNCQL